MTRDTIRRYALFAGEDYYPAGGWDDLIEAFETEDDAISAAEKRLDVGITDWYHIVDLVDGKRVFDNHAFYRQEIKP